MDYGLLWRSPVEMKLDPRIIPNGPDSFEIHLSDVERKILFDLTDQVKQLIEEKGTFTERLFPPAYLDNFAMQHEYEQLIVDDLIASHQQALLNLKATIGASRLSNSQVHSWLEALNCMRLIIGTKLGIENEGSSSEVNYSDTTIGSIYLYLSWLQEQAVEAGQSSLD